ncbi:hypothetical protein M9Y10_028769 [Tritrichomonas musculus]|uniref:Viral A-type inclusion protein n=1 Tax=Tritrichomonas musculus TaxID=1915356 RepID=A0ABR2KL45_9EUKA
MADSLDEWIFDLIWEAYNNLVGECKQENNNNYNLYDDFLDYIKEKSKDKYKEYDHCLATIEFNLSIVLNDSCKNFFKKIIELNEKYDQYMNSKKKDELLRKEISNLKEEIGIFRDKIIDLQIMNKPENPEKINEFKSFYIKNKKNNEKLFHVQTELNAMLLEGRKENEETEDINKTILAIKSTLTKLKKEKESNEKKIQILNTEITESTEKYDKLKNQLDDEKKEKDNIQQELKIKIEDENSFNNKLLSLKSRLIKYSNDLENFAKENDMPNNTQTLNDIGQLLSNLEKKYEDSTESEKKLKLEANNLKSEKDKVYDDLIQAKNENQTLQNNFNEQTKEKGKLQSDNKDLELKLSKSQEENIHHKEVGDKLASALIDICYKSKLFETEEKDEQIELIKNNPENRENIIQDLKEKIETIADFAYQRPSLEDQFEEFKEQKLENAKNDSNRWKEEFIKMRLHYEQQLNKLFKTPPEHYESPLENQS